MSRRIVIVLLIPICILFYSKVVKSINKSIVQNESKTLDTNYTNGTNYHEYTNPPRPLSQRRDNYNVQCNSSILTGGVMTTFPDISLPRNPAVFATVLSVRTGTPHGERNK